MGRLRLYLISVYHLRLDIINNLLLPLLSPYLSEFNHQFSHCSDLLHDVVDVPLL